MMKLAALLLMTALALAPAADADAGDTLIVETQSESVSCEMHSVLRQTPTSPVSGGKDAVYCQGPFTQPGATNSPWTAGDGKLGWAASNNSISSAIPRLKLQYNQTYRWGDWVINPDATGTRFTNTSTGHGMFVSVEKVYPF